MQTVSIAKQCSLLGQPDSAISSSDNMCAGVNELKDESSCKLLSIIVQL